MRLRTIGAMAGAVFAGSFLGLAGDAVAQYPPGADTLTLSAANVPAGGVLEVSGTGAAPNGQINFVLFSHPKPLGSATADAGGAFRAGLTIPCDAEQGGHTLSATGPDYSQSGSVTVSGTTGACATSVTTTGGGGGGGGTTGTTGTLPRTGSSSTAPLVAAGVGLVLIGSSTVVAARRRRATVASA